MNPAVITAILRYLPTVIQLLAEIGPVIKLLIDKYGAAHVVAKVTQSAQAAQVHEGDVLAQAGALIGNLTAHFPELRALEPTILRHIQNNADAAIRQQELADRNQ